MSSLNELLKPYIKQVEAGIAKEVAHFGQSDELAEAIAYALQAGGKRLRPAIVLMVAEALGEADVLDAALSLEHFHTASLLADDLPMMDDADERRGHLATHKKFDEATALLASYALIARGYELLALNAEKNSCKTNLLLALQSVSKNTGYQGASGGQYLDLRAKNITDSLVLEVMQKKTAALFESSFLLGWVYSGKAENVVSVKRLGMDFGVAFQIVDDLLDYEEDIEGGRKISYAVQFGIEGAVKQVTNRLYRCKAGLRELGLATAPLLGLVEFMQNRLAKAKMAV